MNIKIDGKKRNLKYSTECVRAIRQKTGLGGRWASEYLDTKLTALDPEYLALFLYHGLKAENPRLQLSSLENSMKKLHDRDEIKKLRRLRELIVEAIKLYKSNRIQAMLQREVIDLKKRIKREREIRMTETAWR